MSVPDEDVKQRILTLPGPYCSSKRVYNTFSSSSHPAPKKTEDYMRDLETASLGQVEKLGKSTVFYQARTSKHPYPFRAPSGELEYIFGAIQRQLSESRGPPNILPERDNAKQSSKA